MLHRRALKVTRIGFITRGPIAEDADSITLVTQQVIEGLKQTAHVYLVILPSYQWTEIVPVLSANGFYPKPNLLAPDHLVTATTVIDLNQDLEKILGKMRASTRYSIRRGMKHGLEIIQGGEAEIDAMHRLLCQLCARRGITPSPAQASEFHDIWQCLAPKGMAKLFLCRYQSEIISSAFVLICGGSMLVTKVGWSGQHAELNPNHVMWWEMIKWAKEAGLKQFDFHGLMPAHARAILNGEPLSEDGASGITLFKTGFGGDVIAMPDSYYRSFRPEGQAALRLGGAQLLSKGRIQRLVNRLAHSVPRQFWVG